MDAYEFGVVWRRWVNFCSNSSFSSGSVDILFGFSLISFDALIFVGMTNNELRERGKNLELCEKRRNVKFPWLLKKDANEGNSIDNEWTSSIIEFINAW